MKWLKGFFLLILVSPALDGMAGISTNSETAYLLTEGSTLVDDCPICGRPTIFLPMRGSFKLVLVGQDALFTRYEVRDISFQAGGNTWPHKVTGSGFYEIGGEVALQERMTLQVYIDNGVTNQLCYFTNIARPRDRLWPMLDLELAQTNGTLTQLYTLDIAAAPVRELWFSTGTNFTASKWQSSSNRISNGDFLSASGRVVKSNTELTRNLGVMPVTPDLGLDAVDIGSGGEILFSITQNVFSETLGPLQHGDLLSNRGKVVKRNQQLLAAFGSSLTNFDAGLDAVQVLEDGQILFSTVKDVLSGETPVLFRGDILSDRGQVFRTHQQLLARFHPAQTNRDFGLDSFYVWPSGEIWFSTQDDFQDNGHGLVHSGDLLSDQGYRVFSSAELVSAFSPIETNSNFGLDSLYLVTDIRSSKPPSRLIGIDHQRYSPEVTIRWTGAGRTFQVERAIDLPGSFVPCSPIVCDSTFTDTPGNGDRFFYRLRQW